LALFRREEFNPIEELNQNTLKSVARLMPHLSKDVKNLSSSYLKPVEGFA
jgi:hypothetical protein